MPWHVGDFASEVKHVVGRGVGHLAPGVLLTAGIAERPRHVAHRRSTPIGDHVGDLCAVLAAIPSVHVLDRLLTTVRFDVDIDVRWPVTLGREEPLEQQLVGHRVDVGDTQRVTHRGVGSTPPTLAQDVVAFTEVDDVGDDEKIAGEGERLDDRQLVLDLPVGRRMFGWCPIAASCAGHGEMP